MNNSSFPNMESTDKLKKDAFLKGVKQGIELFAYWTKGEQYVGSGRITLKRAIEKLEDGSLHDLLVFPK